MTVYLSVNDALKTTKRKRVKETFFIFPESQTISTKFHSDTSNSLETFQSGELTDRRCLRWKIVFYPPPRFSASTMSVCCRARTCHEPGHESFRELHNTVVNVL